MKHIGVILAILAVLIVGCSGGKAAGDFQELKFSLTGGIAGFNQSITIAPDGSYTITDREKEAGRGKIGGDDLTGLKERVAKVQWAQLQPQYTDPKVADAMFETVTITLGSKSYTVAVGTSGTPPQELTELNAMLRQLLSDTRPT